MILKENYILSNGVEIPKLGLGTWMLGSEQADLDNILGSYTVKPMVNQILVHISNTPDELIKYIQDRGIMIIGIFRVLWYEKGMASEYHS
ncbi:MAG: hypothetical protein LKI42_04320 [Bacteroidales bacterium]|jgi:diketogulonate reductase-like aldo/keto reductase|nr:hypothetical protein [Bacteroidales bacterium]MCI1785180.1 hypothetical protein [Bacteroidales bacterium]